MIAYLDAKFNLYWEEDEEGCWIWNATKNRNGYGLFYINDYGNIPAHRYSAFRFVTGYDKEKNNTVLHSCDNPRCVNPKHLSWSTQLNNVKDMMEKGRAAFRKFEGEEHGMSKLKECDVIDIIKRLKLGEMPKSISKDYSVNDRCIGNIKAGRAWKHVPR